MSADVKEVFIVTDTEAGGRLVKVYANKSQADLMVGLVDGLHVEQTALLTPAQAAVLEAAEALGGLIDDYGYQSGGPVTINSADPRLLLATLTQLLESVTTIRAQEAR